MSTSARFTQELAHLVWLLVHRPAQVDDQKHALRAMLRDAAVEGRRVDHSAVGLAVVEGADQHPLPEHLGWLSELATRMASHSVRSIEAHRGARAAELLGLARALARPGRRGDQGQAFDAVLQALAPTTLSVHLGQDGFVRTPTPPTVRPAVGSRLTPVPGSPLAPVAVTEEPRMLETAFMPSVPASDLVIRLRGELTAEVARGLLDGIARKVEDEAREGSWVGVIDLVSKLMEREEAVTDPAVRRAFDLQLRRLATPGLLRGVAQLLPPRRDLRDPVHRFLARQGTTAAEVLIELLTRAETTTERRAYHDAIVQCPAAIPRLVELLHDERWYVVRNAAELLGEMKATGADEALVGLLGHQESRVRQAATLALVRLGTPGAVQATIRALADRDASVRLRAAQGLSLVQTPQAVPALLGALDAEEDDETRQALLAALGRYPEASVIERLVREAAPGSLFKRRPQGRRLAAIQALGDAGTHEARAALRAMVKDRDPVVRELVDRLLRDGAPEVAVHH
jgi:hypothetical protein